MFFHIDIDAFFASVEINKRQEIRNLPVIVCGKSYRSVVGCANYIARSYGIEAGMPVEVANRLCKKVINIFTNNESFLVYTKFSDIFMTCIRNNFGNLIEQISIDECYLQIKDVNYKQAYKIAYQIKNHSFAKTKLTCSIGIGSNKFLARMATQFAKPKGVFMLNEQNFKDKIWPLPIEKMLYVGKKTSQKLNKIGIFKVVDLIHIKNENKLKKILGKHYIEHINHAYGICYEKINTNKVPCKSISTEETFVSDLYDESECYKKIHDLCWQSLRRLQNRGLLCKTIALKIKYTNFNLKVFSTTLNHYSNDFHLLYTEFINLFNKNNELNKRAIRLIGIGFAHLKYISEHFQNPTLFDHQFTKQQIQLLDIINKINNKIGEHCVDLACNLLLC